MKTIHPKEMEHILMKTRKRKIGRAIRRLILLMLSSITVFYMAGMITLETIDNRAERDEDHLSAASDNQIELKDNQSAASGDQSEEKDNQSAVNDHQSEDDWYLLLINYEHAIPDDYSVSLLQLKNEQSVDERIYPELQDMFDAARAEGIFPLISSSYRTTVMQEKLFEEKVEEYKQNGYLNDQAEQLAKMWVALPGTSEHQIGLAVDIVVDRSEVTQNSQTSNDVHQWLMANSYKYGFILRYPEGKTDITGVNYEPWHYRYVGKEVAKEMTEKGICFEEYLEALNQ